MAAQIIDGVDTEPLLGSRTLHMPLTSGDW
jgi:hypothetical protein